MGFQTKARTAIARTVEAIDRAVPATATNTGKPARITTEDAIAIIDLIEKTLDNSEVDPFDWEAMRSAIEYYSRIAAPESVRGYCYVLAETNRELSRIHDSGRFSNAPHTKQQEGILSQLGERLPIVMLFRQKERR
ncbi:MAG: hypothetical protein IPO30_20540 [Hyphomonadaceae bacterium]|nr:hypothetical protein [Hyphomonadaceae bacterium]